MIKYNGKEMTARQAAKRWLYERGAHNCWEPFNPHDNFCFCFGATDEEMPTEKEQQEFNSELAKQKKIVARFMGIDEDCN